jgi:hypothetical protein
LATPILETELSKSQPECAFKFLPYNDLRVPGQELARTSPIRHKASGVTLQTPLLIPSFSSKGFAKSKKDGKSDIGAIFAAASEFLTESYLISAYDVYYKNLPEPAQFTLTPELIFIDSGGYEISTDRDYSSVIDPLPAPEEWDISKWESVVSSWSGEIPAVAVSYDHHEERLPFTEQVELARKRFRCCPQHLHSLLIKPEKATQNLLTEALRSTIASASELGSFDLVSVTEKELGRSMLDRMAQIAKLRIAMDEASVSAPIHVFGALDPLSVCLYYIAGAEVFDGLTWIRYAFDNGQCVYAHNNGALKYGINALDNQIKSRTLADNCYYLQDLQQKLRDFETTKKWDKLHPNNTFIEDAYDSLTTRLKRRA